MALDQRPRFSQRGRVTDTRAPQPRARLRWLAPAIAQQTQPMSAEVWLVTGAQASGKSTVADLLARQFERGVHVRGGQFYRWAVRGWIEFDDPEQQREARRLLDLRYRLSARVAVEYASAGFTCVVQDNIYGDDVTAWLETVQPTHLVVLRPDVSTVAGRDEARNRASGKVAYRVEGQHPQRHGDGPVLHGVTQPRYGDARGPQQRYWGLLGGARRRRRPASARTPSSCPLRRGCRSR